MKTKTFFIPQKPIIFVLFLTFFISCSDLNTFDDNGVQIEAALKSESGERMVPFKAVFQSHGADDQFATLCSEPEGPNSIWLLDHQIGEGTGLHLGKFSFDMHFCFHLVLDLSGGFDFENGFGEVTDGYGYFETANGDKLFIIAPAARVLPDEDQELFYFDDIFYFNGGTGSFEGVHGEFRAFSTLPAGGPSDNVWEGTLMLPNAVKANN